MSESFKEWQRLREALNPFMSNLTSMYVELPNSFQLGVFPFGDVPLHQYLLNLSWPEGEKHTDFVVRGANQVINKAKEWTNYAKNYRG